MNEEFFSCDNDFFFSPCYLKLLNIAQVCVSQWMVTRVRMRMRIEKPGQNIKWTLMKCAAEWHNNLNHKLETSTVNEWGKEKNFHKSLNWNFWNTKTINSIKREHKWQSRGTSARTLCSTTLTITIIYI